MYYAIQTRFAGPTNTRGARILVTWDRDRLACPYQYGSTDGEHYAAVVAICAKRKLFGTFVATMLDDSIHLFAPLSLHTGYGPIHLLESPHGEQQLIGTTTQPEK